MQGAGRLCPAGGPGPGHLHALQLAHLEGKGGETNLKGPEVYRQHHVGRGVMTEIPTWHVPRVGLGAGQNGFISPLGEQIPLDLQLCQGHLSYRTSPLLLSNNICNLETD